MRKQLGSFGALLWIALLLVALLLSPAPKAEAAATAGSSYGFHGQQYLTSAFNYYALAYNDAPVGHNGMMHKAVNNTCIQCHANLAHAPVGNTYAFEAYLYSFYAAHYAAAAYRADVQGDTATARTYYYYAYTYGHSAYTYGLKSYKGQYFNTAGPIDAAVGNSFARTGYMYCYYASQGS